MQQRDRLRKIVLARRTHRTYRRFSAALLAGLLLAGQARAEEVADLRAQIATLVAAAKAGEAATAVELQKKLVLPDHRAWFTRVFGAENGAAAAAEYSEFAAYLGSETAAQELGEVAREGRAEVQVQPVKDTGNPQNYRDQLFALMKEKVPAYHVHLIEPGDPKHFFDMGFFTDEAGQFRSLGDLRALRR